MQMTCFIPFLLDLVATYYIPYEILKKIKISANLNIKIDGFATPSHTKSWIKNTKHFSDHSVRTSGPILWNNLEEKIKKREVCKTIPESV